MNKIFANTNVGRKNIAFGMLLFLLIGVLVGIPLTVDLFGGSMLTTSQYQTWKVLHAYGVFLAFINFFFGYCVDRLNLTRLQKEISSWSFLIAGLVGGFGRPALFMLSGLAAPATYVISFIETAGFIIGTLLFVRGLIKQPSEQPIEQPARAVSAPR